MKIEMKSIKHYASMSQETYCYTAKVYVNGKPFAIVSDQGDGGSTDISEDPRCPSYSATKELVEEHFASLPKEIRWGVEFSKSFEVWCGEQVTLFLHKKTLKKELKKLVGIKDGTIYTWKGSVNPSNLAHLSAEGYKMLNSLEFDEALKLFVEAAGL